MTSSDIAYCTNVHPGVTLDEVCANLRTHVAAVKQRVCPDRLMPVGLWLAHDAAEEALREPERLELLQRTLDDSGLHVTTLNGFPYQSFHGQPVKHRVYQPDWSTQQRFDYTLMLATLLAELIPEGGEASISTLPLGYSTMMNDAAVEAAAARLTDLVHWLARLELTTGKCIHIDLEPEPGCVLQRSQDVVDFFESHLLGTPDEPSIRGYLRVCHDVCHAAVMREPQAEVLKRYRGAGLGVGKVQVSSAIEADFDSASDVTDMREQLARFVEPVYLHQTTVSDDSAETKFYEDLDAALSDTGDSPSGTWRVHFHVPLFLDAIESLGTTHGEIDEALSAVANDVTMEIETYAWPALPEPLQPGDLSEGIAKEIRWLQDRAP